MLYIELPTEGAFCRARVPTDFRLSVSWIAKGKGTIPVLFRLEHGRAVAIPQTTPEKPTGNQDEFNAALRSEDETRRVSAALTNVLWRIVGKRSVATAVSRRARHTGPHSRRRMGLGF
jgi:hypothetical protein